MTYSSREEARPVLNATRARQARWGRHVFWVLVFGTLLAALGLLFAWIWRAEQHPGPAGTAQEQVSGRAYDTPAPPNPTLQQPTNTPIK
ncbi:MAG TPA: hypothetical protein VN914_05000 [Polyangia bacterium]|nr:hypothetical protein [Polyangia bacterium]